MDALDPAPGQAFAPPAAGAKVPNYLLVIQTGTIGQGATAQPSGPSAPLVLRSLASGVYHYEATFANAELPQCERASHQRSRTNMGVNAAGSACQTIIGALSFPGATAAANATSTAPLPIGSDTLFPAFAPTLTGMNVGIPFTAPVSSSSHVIARQHRGTNFDITWFDPVSGTPVPLCRRHSRSGHATGIRIHHGRRAASAPRRSAATVHCRFLYHQSHPPR